MDSITRRPGRARRLRTPAADIKGRDLATPEPALVKAVQRPSSPVNGQPRGQAPAAGSRGVDRERSIPSGGVLGEGQAVHLAGEMRHVQVRTQHTRGQKCCGQRRSDKARHLEAEDGSERMAGNGRKGTVRTGSKESRTLHEQAIMFIVRVFSLKYWPHRLQSRRQTAAIWA